MGGTRASEVTYARPVHDAAAASRVDSRVDSWARHAFRRTTSRPGVHRVGLALLEGGGRRLRFTASDRDHDGALSWCDIDAYEDVPLNTAVRTGTAVMGAVDDLDPRYAAFADRQRDTPTTAVGAFPVRAGGRVAGAFVIFYDSPEAFAVEDRSALMSLADELGAALRPDHRGAEPVIEEDELPPAARSARHRVPADLAEAGAARRFLRRTLSEWDVDDDPADTAVLCLSELVTNALIHTDAGCVVVASLDQDVLTVRVRDSGDGMVPGDDAGDPLRVHGRGLRVVAALSSRWGSDSTPGGSTVWFELDLAG